MIGVVTFQENAEKMKKNSKVSLDCKLLIPLLSAARAKPKSNAKTQNNGTRTSEIIMESDLKSSSAVMFDNKHTIEFDHILNNQTVLPS